MDKTLRRRLIMIVGGICFLACAAFGDVYYEWGVCVTPDGTNYKACTTSGGGVCQIDDNGVCGSHKL